MYKGILLKVHTNNCTEDFHTMVSLLCTCTYTFGPSFAIFDALLACGTWVWITWICRASWNPVMGEVSIRACATIWEFLSGFRTGRTTTSRQTATVFVITRIGATSVVINTLLLSRTAKCALNALQIVKTPS